jgi:hypothetical protein
MSTTHKRLFQVANILNRPWSKFLVRVDLYTGIHKKQFVVEVKVGKGAGYKNGSTLYLATNCFTRDRAFNARKPIQIGWSRFVERVPYAD